MRKRGNKFVCYSLNEMTLRSRDTPIQGQLASIETSDGGATLRLTGDWRLPHIQAVAAALRALPKPARVVALDGGSLIALDTAGALAALRYLQRIGADPKSAAPRNFTPHHQRIIELVAGQLAKLPSVGKPRSESYATIVGRDAVEFVGLLISYVQFLGYTAAGIGTLILHPWKLRLKELAAQFQQVGITAIPVVVLVTFLIGVVIAYLLGLQAEKYGASIFVVDGVAIGMAREFSPILVAVIIAGRSGAAFTAQLGTMKLTEETDAIRVLGLSPMDVLILPRVFAIVVALPLLVFLGVVMGILGGMFMANVTLGITPATYIERLHAALSLRHVVAGLAKAPIFAFFIAIIGIRMGMMVSRDTRAIGINTTSTVVQSIVSVILLDALFAVVFQKLGV